MPTIGREQELERIQTEIVELTPGRPRLLLFSGEAGIGKSRLLAETSALVRRQGGRVASGRCLDESGMPPFMPWLEISSELDRFGDGDQPLSLSELLLEQVEGSPDSIPNPEGRRLRLYVTTCSLLANLSKDRLLLLVFDDLQWSDPSSNQLLRYVSSHLGNSRLIIAGAHRPHHEPENSDLSKTIEELDRSRQIAHIPLARLSRAQSTSLLHGLTGASTFHSIEDVHLIAAGSPFAIEEIARVLIEGEHADSTAIETPNTRGIDEIVLRRFNSRSPKCRQILTLAALSGREIEFQFLSRVTGLAASELLDSLEEAASVGLILEEETVNRVRSAEYCFVHDRVREVIAGTVSGARRRQMHARIASALADNTGNNSPGILARRSHHLEMAHDFEQAALVYQQLGDIAISMCAFDDATSAFQRAISLFPTSDGSLWHSLGMAQLHAGDPNALDSLHAAEQAFRAAGDDRGTARALQSLGSVHARRENHDQAIASLRAAASMWKSISGEAAGSSLITAETELCTILGTSLGRYEEALTYGASALVSATELGGHPDLEARARLALASAQLRAGDLRAGQLSLEPALALALQADQKELAAEIAGTLANYSYWTADLSASDRFARMRRELGIACRDPYALRHTLPWLANIKMAQGDWEGARQCIAEAEADLARIESPEPRAFLDHLSGMIALQRGELGIAIPRLEEAISGFRKIGAGTLPWYLGVLARAYFVAGDFSSMERISAETLSAIGELPDRALPKGPSLAQLGLIAASTGDRAGAARFRTELDAYRGQHHWVLMDRVRGMLAATLGEHEQAVVILREAAQAAARGTLRPELALIRAELAKLNNASPAEWVEIHTELRAIGLAEADTYESNLPSARPIPAGLSEREIEVLLLVVKGHTNRQIADLLSISEKTVTNHLTHIFTKANLDNRASAVAFALRHGLVK